MDKVFAAEVLGKGYWFGKLGVGLQQRILDAGEIQDVRRTKTLFRKGEPPTGLCAVLSGDVRLFGSDGNGEKYLIRALGPTAWFGNFSMLDEHARQLFDVRCVGQAKLLFLSRANHAALSASDSEASHAFVELLHIHAMQLVQAVADARGEAPVRAARALLQLALAHGRAVSGGIELGIHLSQSDLAALV